MPLYRYSRWDGSQQVFPIGEEDLMDQLSEEMVVHGDITRALISMAQRGVGTRFSSNGSGIQNMLQSLRSMRQGILEKYSLEHILDDSKWRLRHILQVERHGLDRRLAEAWGRVTSQTGLDESPSPSKGEGWDGGEFRLPPTASHPGRENCATPTGRESELLLQCIEEMVRSKREFLDNLPSQLGPALQRLSGYEFVDEVARADFDELLASLQRRFLSSSLGEVSSPPSSGSSRRRSPSLAGALRDVNRLLEHHRSGGETPGDPSFGRFMQRYRELFGASPPASVEELAEKLWQGLSHMESLRRSLSPESGRELGDVIDSIFRDSDLSDELERLTLNVGAGKSVVPTPRELEFTGNETMGLEQALEVICRLHSIEALDRQLGSVSQQHDLDNVRPELVRELMGEDAYRELEQLRGMADVLENAGYIERLGSRLELTPKGLRKIGQKALREVFSCMTKDRLGGHQTNGDGVGGDLLEDTKKYEYGDPFNLHLQRSVMNAVQRTPGAPVRMKAEDFEIHRAEHSSLAATVLMLDLSLSMAMRGNFLPAKKVALALDHLIRTQFPRDALHIVGFSTYAREVKADELAYLSWDDFDPYTNIQVGLAVARKILAKTQGCTKQVIMISDGEPTAHMERGQVFFQYPPSPRTLQETLKEVKRCSRQDIKINTFMLERSPCLTKFVEQMARINRGRVFYTSPHKLGEYLLVDYLTSRRKQIA